MGARVDCWGRALLRYTRSGKCIYVQTTGVTFSTPSMKADYIKGEEMSCAKDHYHVEASSNSTRTKPTAAHCPQEALPSLTMPFQPEKGGHL